MRECHSAFVRKGLKHWWWYRKIHSKTAYGVIFALLQFKIRHHLEVAAVYQTYWSNLYTKEPRINLWQLLWLKHSTNQILVAWQKIKIHIHKIMW